MMASGDGQVGYLEGCARNSCNKSIRSSWNVGIRVDRCGSMMVKRYARRGNQLSLASLFCGFILRCRQQQAGGNKVAVVDFGGVPSVMGLTEKKRRNRSDIRASLIVVPQRAAPVGILKSRVFWCGPIVVQRKRRRAAMVASILLLFVGKTIPSSLLLFTGKTTHHQWFLAVD
ncbi:unnamed protein product [Lactuca saligna]|uniref:Uncharacterized protein n=1 Tax=Lactuca saligna TaxID=75948 RepID=A0AA35V803_LACSI|nr:unnamed protein product [Lactuca saligna]